jgi:hypothetical protein
VKIGGFTHDQIDRASRAEKNINFEFDGSNVLYMPVQTNVAELGAMRFTRMR